MKNEDSENKNMPWVEKYRPTTFDNIVLEENNKNILRSIIKSGIVPNLLLYGPPGTGKTTTAINFINLYQKKFNIKNNELVMHLNASDERGIDVIRNQINQFVNSKSLFSKGTKFVILDEVDYMTKSAQQALKYLISSISENVCFILICNYICKIDDVTQNIFIKLRFNQLSNIEIEKYLNKVIISENIKINMKQIEHIISYFKSDIRSMINYLQSNFFIINNNNNNNNIINNTLWNNLTDFIIQNKSNPKKIDKKICDISFKYNSNIYQILKIYSLYLIKNTQINVDFLNYIEIFIHKTDYDTDSYKHLFIQKLVNFL